MCIYGIILDPEVTFAGMDFLNLSYPRVFQVKDALTTGHLPLWNWNEWGGSPLLATVVGAAFYPGTWLALLFPLPYGLQLFVFFHLYLAAVGAYRAARIVCGLPHGAATLCGIVYIGNSFFPGRIEQFQILATNTLFPWLLLAVWSCRGGGLAIAQLALVWALTLFAGHPQYAAFNLLGALGLCAVFHLVGRTVVQWRVIAGVTAGVALGTAAAAVQMFPTWELSRLSERVWPYADPTVPEIGWAHLPALAIPRFYNLVTGEVGRVFGYTELGLYAGLLALPVAIAGVILVVRRKSDGRRVAFALLVVWIIAMVFAMGKNGFIATLVYDHAPFFKNSRGAARSLNVAALMLALLAGIGVQQLMENRYHLRAAGWVLCGVFCADLAATHFSSLKSVLVPVSTLNARMLVSGADMKAQSPAGRLYRFMSKDSDLYLNNATAAVAERYVRLQPNLGTIKGMAVTDGYEEGLLPLRAHANLFRKYNRNVRNDSPDVALLAFLGSNLMLTEFPLPKSEEWNPLFKEFPRPSVVPPIVPGSPAVYRFYASDYKVMAPALNLDALLPPDKQEDFLRACVAAFPLEQPDRENTANAWSEHPFSQITPEAFVKAQQNFAESGFEYGWNRLTLKVSGGVEQVLLLMTQYPGWKMENKNLPGGTLKSLCSILYLARLGSDVNKTESFSVTFSPYSVRLGIFVSLIAMSVIISVLGYRFLHPTK